MDIRALSYVTEQQQQQQQQHNNTTTTQQHHNNNVSMPASKTTTTTTTTTAMAYALDVGSGGSVASQVLTLVGDLAGEARSQLGPCTEIANNLNIAVSYATVAVSSPLSSRSGRRLARSGSSARGCSCRDHEVVEVVNEFFGTFGPLGGSGGSGGGGGGGGGVQKTVEIL